MRKYKRLIMLVVASMSLILMFVYRHKYSKLNSLFEMMNAFQSKSSEAIYKDKLYAFQKSLNADFNRQEQIVGLPFWSEMFPGIYIYSSYWLFNRTRSLFFTKKVALKKIVEIQCILNYEDRKSGDTKSRIILLEKRGSQILFYVECDSNPKVPDSINFVYENMNSTFPLPIIKQIETARSISEPNITQASNTGQYTACVAPFPPALGDVYKVLEFIIYYYHLGVKNFILYDTGLSSNVRNLLLDIAVKNGMHVLLLAWNIPFGTLQNFKHAEVYYLDCFHRVIARGYSGFILKLNINDYIVPEGNWNISHFIKESNSDVSVYKFHHRKFCTNFPKNIIALNLFMPFVTLSNTKVSNEKVSPIQIAYNTLKLKEIFLDSNQFHTWLLKKKSQKENLISDIYGILHSYEKCEIQMTNETKHYSEDKIMWKFKDLFFKSYLYMLAKEQHLIDG